MTQSQLRVLRRPSAFRAMGRAFAYRNYRLFFLGQGISLIGTWMTRVATGWLVFRLSGSDPAFLLGVVGFAGQIPSFFLAPIPGLLFDPWNRHRPLFVPPAPSPLPSPLLPRLAFRS